MGPPPRTGRAAGHRGHAGGDPPGIQPPHPAQSAHGNTSMSRLKGKRALITGGTSGIGLAAALRFMSEGARVAITGRSQANLESARKELGSGVLVIPSDAGDLASQPSVAETVRRE